MKLGAQGGFFFDGVEPAPIRMKVEQAKTDREDARRARGDYNMKPVKNGQGSMSAEPIEQTEAWATYQDQLARGMGEPEDYAGMLRIVSKRGAE